MTEVIIFISIITGLIGSHLGAKKQMGAMWGFFCGALCNVVGLSIIVASQNKDANHLNVQTSKADELEKWHNLFQTGVITQNEFEQKKQELLS